MADSNDEEDIADIFPRGSVGDAMESEERAWILASMASSSTLAQPRGSVSRELQRGQTAIERKKGEKVPMVKFVSPELETCTLEVWEPTTPYFTIAE